MRIFIYIFLLLVSLVACKPINPSDTETTIGYDSVYVIADIQWHKQYYPLLDKQVFSIDLLSEGLDFDSTNHIVGTGINLYFSDIFLPLTDTVLQEGIYRMNSTPEAYTFLPYMYFEGNITGCYMLNIQEGNIERIIGFTAGEFEIITMGDDDIRMDISLYTADSTHYHATYQGLPFIND